MKEIRNDFRNRNRKQSQRSFYTAACAVLACAAVLAGVYFQTEKTDRQVADQSQANLASTTAGEAAISSPGKTGTKEQESTQASTTLRTQKKTQATKAPRSKVEVSANQAQEKKEKKEAKATTANTNKRTFQEESGLTWPVKGDVLMKFSQNNTIYFKTLAQYKSNPAIEISADEGTKVIASAPGRVTKISKDDVTGTMITTDIGSGYQVTYGQLKDLKVSKGDEVKEGQLLGKVGTPTKYFSEEGSNLFFQVTENGTAVDPLLLLK